MRRILLKIDPSYIDEAIEYGFQEYDNGCGDKTYELVDRKSGRVILFFDIFEASFVQDLNYVVRVTEWAAKHRSGAVCGLLAMLSMKRFTYTHEVEDDDEARTV